mgnify:CR=1 FL=1
MGLLPWADISKDRFANIVLTVALNALGILAKLNEYHLHTVRGMMYYHKALQVQRLVESSEGWYKEMYWPKYNSVRGNDSRKFHSF